MTDIHSCSYYCDRPECIKAQRDELRERLAQPEQETAAKAWDEGYRQGVEDECISAANIGIAGFGAKVKPARQNPYGITPPQRKPEQEPNYWLGYGLQAHTEKPFKGATPLYTAPPQRKPLTDEEIEACRQQGFAHSGLSASFDFVKAARAIEAAHGIKEQE